MLELLEKAKLLSEQISSKIDKKDWQAVEKLQNQREKLLANIATVKLPHDKQELKRIKSISTAMQLEISQQISDSNTQKKNLLNQIKNNNKSNKMRAAYKTTNK